MREDFAEFGDIQETFRTDGVRRRYGVWRSVPLLNLADLRVVREVGLRAAHWENNVEVLEM